MKCIISLGKDSTGPGTYPINIERTTYSVNEAVRSAWVKLNPALHLVKFPVLVSNATSVPSPRTLVPITPEKLTTGFAVNPMLVLIPA